MAMFKKNLLSNAIKRLFWGTNLYKKSFFWVFAKGARDQW